MNNQNNNWNYQGLIEMSQDVLTIVRQIEDNGGEISEELELAFNELGMEIDEKLFRVYNIVRELEGSIGNKDAEIARLTAKKKAIQNSVENWKRLATEITKQAGVLNGSGNPNRVSNGVSFTVTKSKSVNVADDFHNPEFVTYKLKDGIPEEHFNTIAKYLKHHLKLADVKMEKVVDKVGIKKRLDEIDKKVKNGEEVEELVGASIVEKENILMK